MEWHAWSHACLCMLASCLLSLGRPPSPAFCPLQVLLTGTGTAKLADVGLARMQVWLWKRPCRRVEDAGW